MWDILLEAFVDSLKTLPILFVAFLIIELVEHNSLARLTQGLAKAGRFAPAVGALLGVVPQCGFSVMGANLYSERLISLGTLLAVFLATSDEALIIMLSHRVGAESVLLLVGAKLVIAMLAGFITDMVYRKKPVLKNELSQMHDECEKGVLKSTVVRTLKVFAFIFIVSFILGAAVELIGMDSLKNVILSGSAAQPLLAALVGLIPNCAASVLITELYIEGVIPFSSALAGLCSAAGAGLLVLFRYNKNLRGNFIITAVLWGIASLSGIVLSFFGI